MTYGQLCSFRCECGYARVQGHKGDQERCIQYHQVLWGGRLSQTFWNVLLSNTGRYDPRRVVISTVGRACLYRDPIALLPGSPQGKQKGGGVEGWQETVVSSPREPQWVVVGISWPGLREPCDLIHSF